MKKQTKKGITLIESLIGIFILCVMVFGVYGMYNYSLRIVREKGRREEALAIAAEEMEFFRSIDYDTLGTAATNCVPNPCSLPSVKSVTKNGVNYTVLTDIRYIDDPFDEEGIDDTTGVNDYKTTRVEVRWGEPSDYDSLVFVSTFAPIGIEQNCTGGILKINVFDANALPVSETGIYIKNNNLAYEYDTRTNDQGVLRINCLTEDLNNNYEITVNKPGALYYDESYSIAQTCPSGTGTPNPICPKASPANNNPTDPHLNIINGETTEKSFAIDLLSVLSVETITANLPNEWTVNDTPGDGNIQNIQAMDIGPGNTYYFIWQDDRDGPTRIYSQKFDVLQVAQWGGGGDIQVTVSNDTILPDIAVTSSGNAYAAWSHGEMGNQEIYIDILSSADGSSTWAGGNRLEVWTSNQNDDQINPKINLSGGETFYYLTWLDNSNDENDIYTARLLSGTITQQWLNPSELKINDDMSGNIQALPDTLLDPDTNDLYIVWQDNRWGDNDIWAQKINSLGMYSKEIKISVESDTDADTTSLNGTSIGTFVNGVFAESKLYYYDPDAGTANDSFLFFDEEGGVYDGTEIKIGVESDTNADTTNFNNRPADGSFVYVDPDAWTINDSFLLSYIEDDTGYSEVLKVGVESDNLADTTPLNYNSFLFNGNVIYNDPDSDISDDSYLFLDNNGDEIYDDWGENILISQYYSQEQSNPAIAMSQEDENKFLYFVWQDHQNDNFDIYMSKFTNNGIRVWEDDINITTEDTTLSAQTMPAITINPNDNAIYVAWVDERNGNPDIYMQKFNTSGEKQWIDNIRIENDLKINNDQKIDSTQRWPKIAVNSSNEVLISWYSDDSEPASDLFDIKAAIITDPSPQNVGNVPLRIYGSKTIGQDINENDIYKFDSIFTTDSEGELEFDGNDQPELEWDSYSFEISGGGYSLLRVEPLTPFIINPDTENYISIIVGPDVQTPWKSNENGVLTGDNAWDYTAGYHFTPQASGSITKLGGYFDDTKTVYLWNKDTSELLAQAEVNSSNNWSYTNISPVPVSAGTNYTVAVYLEGNGATCRSNIVILPQTYEDITINASSFIAGNNQPINEITNIMYGQVDIYFIKPLP